MREIANKFFLNISSCVLQRKIWLLAVLFLLMPDISFAAETSPLQAFAQMAAVVIHLLVALFLLLIQFGGDLLGTEFITGDNIMVSLLPMWRFFRNVTNIGFVLILLFLAASNLYSSFSSEGGGEWTIAKKVPKVIFAMIAVNFSLLFFRVAIDIVNVGTIAILSITDKAIEEKDVSQFMDTTFDQNTKPCTPSGENDTSCKSWRQWLNDGMCSKEGLGGPDGTLCVFTKEQIIEKQKDFENLSSTKKNIFLAFAVHFQHIEALPILAAKLERITDVALNILFSLVLGVAYLAAMLAVMIALVMRMVILWLFMIISPLLVAAAIMGIGTGEAGDLSKRLINNIIMPLKIAAAFSLSFVLISGMTGSDFQLANSVQLFAPQPSMSQLLGDSMYGLLWKIATIVIFWEAAFWAIKDSEASFITNHIKSGVQGAGQFLAEAATIDRPIFKMPDGSDFTLGGALKTPQAAMQAFRNERDTNQEAFLGGLVPGYRRTADANQAARDFTQKTKNYGSGNKVEAGREVDTLLHKIGTTEAAQGKSHEEIIALAKRVTNETLAGELGTALKGKRPAEIKRVMEKVFGTGAATGVYTAAGGSSAGGTKSTEEAVSFKQTAGGGGEIKIGTNTYTAAAGGIAAEANKGVIDELRLKVGEIGQEDWNGLARIFETEVRDLKKSLGMVELPGQGQNTINVYNKETFEQVLTGTGDEMKALRAEIAKPDSALAQTLAETLGDRLNGQKFTVNGRELTVRDAQSIRDLMKAGNQAAPAGGADAGGDEDTGSTTNQSSLPTD